MLDFLRLNAILEVLKYGGIYAALAILPLALILWYKRRSYPSGAAACLDGCIRHGSTLTYEQCREVYGIILQAQAAISRFRRREGAGLPGEMDLAGAIALLPLLVEIGQPDSACGQLSSQTEGELWRDFECKREIKYLIADLSRDADIPVIRQELDKIAKVRRKLERREARWKVWRWLFVIFYNLGCFIITNSIMTKQPYLNIGLAMYIGSIVLYLFRYDYYYSRIYNRYAGG